MSYTYLENVYKILKKIETLENDNIEASIELITNTIKNNNQLFVFGASHAGIISEELFYRAGGLALFNPIFEPSIMLSTRPVTKTSEMERLDGYGSIIGRNTKLKKSDCLIIHSVSGRNPVAIDLALYAKSIGVNIIALTNLDYSKNVKSRHKCNKNLYELADIVLDNHGDIGDATVRVDGLTQKVAPTSTVVGSTIMNIIVSETAIRLQKDGVTPPIFFSANIDGGEKHNDEIFKKYKDLIHYQ